MLGQHWGMLVLVYGALLHTAALCWEKKGIYYRVHVWLIRTGAVI